MEKDPLKLILKGGFIDKIEKSQSPVPFRPLKREDLCDWKVQGPSNYSL